VPKQTAPLEVARVRSALAGTRFADVRYVARTGSTNADAQVLLGDATAYGATLIAEFQSMGVGRKARPWLAPPGSSLLFTTILPAAIRSSALWAVPFWIALGVAQAVETATGIALDLVWPNDLFAGQRKTGGILSVARIAGESAWVGCGVGLNVIRPAADPALDALFPAPIFLGDIVAGVEREAVLAAILTAFDASFGMLKSPEIVAAAWEQRANLAGTTYRYRRDSDGIEREGTALRIGPHGTLVLRDESGEVTIDMADVRVIAQHA
jgi:BirA family biotin operon repressor/biotin-[acetyl-CoA-carboxylase] ligase